MICSGCGINYNKQSSYCPNCGMSNSTKKIQTSVQVLRRNGFCDQCGERVEGTAYCKNCGTGHDEITWELGKGRRRKELPEENSLFEGVGDIKKKLVESMSKEEFKEALKNSAVFCAMMFMLTMVFLYALQKAFLNILDLDSDFWEQNEKILDIKPLLLSMMYGIDLKYAIRIAVSVTGTIQLPMIAILVTLLFVKISLVVTKKVTMKQSYKTLELLIFSGINGIVVSLCSLVFSRESRLKLPDMIQEEIGEQLRITFGLGLSFLSAFFWATAITFCFLLLSGGIRGEKQKKYTWQYAMQSHLLIMAATILTGCVMVGILFLNVESNVSLVNSAEGILNIVVRGIVLASAIFKIVTNFANTLLVQIGGVKFVADMGISDIKISMPNIASASLDLGMFKLVLFLLVLFILVKIVLDALQIRKQEKLVGTDRKKICFVYGGYAAQYTFFLVILWRVQQFFFQADFSIKNNAYLDWIDLSRLNNISLQATSGIASIVGSAFLIFLLVFLICVLVHYVAEKQQEFSLDMIVKKKVPIMAICFGLVIGSACIVSYTTDMESWSEDWNITMKDFGEELGKGFDESNEKNQKFMQAVEGIEDLVSFIKWIVAK